MILAETSSDIWLAIVAGIMLVVKQVLDWISLFIKEMLDNKRAAALKAATEESARIIKAAADDTKEKVTAHLQSQDVKMQETVDKVEAVHLATNGMKKDLVEAVRESAIAIGKEAGRKAEQDEFPQGRGLKP